MKILSHLQVVLTDFIDALNRETLCLGFLQSKRVIYSALPLCFCFKWHFYWWTKLFKENRWIRITFTYTKSMYCWFVSTNDTNYIIFLDKPVVLVVLHNTLESNSFPNFCLVYTCKKRSRHILIRKILNI